MDDSDTEWMRHQVDDVFGAPSASPLADRVALVASLVTVGMFLGFVVGLALLASF